MDQESVQANIMHDSSGMRKWNAGSKHSKPRGSRASISRKGIDATSQLRVFRFRGDFRFTLAEPAAFCSVRSESVAAALVEESDAAASASAGASAAIVDFAFPVFAFFVVGRLASSAAFAHSSRNLSNTTW